MPVYKIKECSLGIKQGLAQFLAEGEPSCFLCVHCWPLLLLWVQYCSFG